MQVQCTLKGMVGSRITKRDDSGLCRGTRATQFMRGICCNMSDPKRPILAVSVQRIFRRIRQHTDRKLAAGGEGSPSPPSIGRRTSP